MLRRPVPALLALALAACTLDPRYLRPDLPVASTWPDDSMLAFRPYTAPAALGAASAPPAAAAEIGWRDFFVDARLQRLIEIALANNRDARIAAINVASARALYQIQRADLFPSISVSGQESASRTPSGVLGQSSSGSPTAGNGTTTSSSSGVVSRTYSVGVGFSSYEIDVFGRVRSLSRAALEQYFGYAETQRSAVISLVAEVANAYLTTLADEELLRVTRDTLESQQKSYDLIKRTVDGGVETMLTLRQSETQVQTAAANLAQYTRQLAQDRHALSVLLGTPIPDDMPPSSGIDGQLLPDELPSGLPSELLARRPDVLAAEHNLLAANANIGAARAAFFPAISLTGSYGTSSPQLSGLFGGGSRAWSFSPLIDLPIFRGGANVANLAYSREQKNLFIARYEQTIQTAFREVADALSSRATLDDQQSAQVALQIAAQDAYRLSDLRYSTGVDRYLTVLDSQRTYYTAQQGLVQVKLSRLQNLVTLYKALGGGLNERNGNAVAATGAVPPTPLR